MAWPSLRLVPRPPLAAFFHCCKKKKAARGGLGTRLVWPSLNPICRLHTLNDMQLLSCMLRRETCVARKSYAHLIVRWQERRNNTRRRAYRHISSLFLFQPACSLNRLIFISFHPHFGRLPSPVSDTTCMQFSLVSAAYRMEKLPSLLVPIVVTEYCLSLLINRDFRFYHLFWYVFGECTTVINRPSDKQHIQYVMCFIFFFFLAPPNHTTCREQLTG